MSSTPDTPAAATPPALANEVITRSTSLGTTYKIEVEHQGDGNVKILSWKRKRPGDNKFTQMKEEEGKTYPLHLLTGTPPTTTDEAQQNTDTTEADQQAA